MNRRDIWRLTIHFYPGAIEAGLAPVEVRSYSEEGAQFYRPHELTFENIPTRADFLEVVKQTPWMNCWKDSLLPILTNNPWPIVPGMNKAFSVDLLDANGVQVGKLEVDREHCYTNDSRYRPDIFIHHVEAATKGLRGEKGKQAHALLLNDVRQRAVLLERIVSERAYTEDEVVYILKSCLHEKGLLKSKPSKPLSMRGQRLRVEHRLLPRR